jgi:hypothetical protein
MSEINTSHRLLSGSWRVAGCLLLAACASSSQLAQPPRPLQQPASGQQVRVFDNIVIGWAPAPSGVAVDVTVTMGTALIEELHFTPDTLRKNLNYSNPPQMARGVFTVEFNASGNGGKIYCENLEWKTVGSGGAVTGLVGIWTKAE